MREPVFIVGFQRSGTTLLRLMLDSHPDIAIPLDTVGLWSRYESRLGEYHGLATPEDRDALILDLLKEDRIQLWEVPLTLEQVRGQLTGTAYPDVIRAFYRSYAQCKGKTAWGDKDPGNMLRLPQLNRWFPQCTIVHIIRDGRDACLSQLRQDFGYSDLLPCAEAWREQVFWVRQIGQLVGPARYLELKYEELLGEPEAVLRGVCGFLRIDYSARMLSYYRNVEAAIPDSKRHIWPLIDQPPQSENAGRWRTALSRGDRISFEKRAGRLLKELGYEALPGSPAGGYLAELKSIAHQAWRSLSRRLRGR